MTDLPFVGLSPTSFPKLANILARENNLISINAQTAKWTLDEGAEIDIRNNSISEIAVNTIDFKGIDFIDWMDSISDIASIEDVETMLLNSIVGFGGGFKSIINATLRFLT